MTFQRSSFQDDQRGLTIVELLIVMIVTVVVTTAVLNFAIDFWGNSATLQSDLDTLVTRNNAGDSLREALNVSSGMVNQNSLPDAHPLSPDPADATGQYWKPIHAIPGNTPIGASGTYTPLLYYESPVTDSAKNIVLNGSQPFKNQFVLYLNGTTKQLLLRTIADSSAPSNSKRTSCPLADVSSSCPADQVIADDISSVDMRYFSRSGNPVNYTAITDPLTGDYIGPDFPAAEVVEFTLHLYKKATIHGTQDTVNSTIIRVAIRNR